MSADKGLRLEIDPQRRGIAHIVGADDLAGFLLGMRCARVVACVNAMDGISDPSSYRAAADELIKSVSAYDKAKKAAISNPALDGEYQEVEARMDAAVARIAGESP
jgi:hypothetical protein